MILSGALAALLISAPSVSPEVALDAPIARETPGVQHPPRIACSGSTALVAYADANLPHVAHASLVDAAGTLIDGGSFRLLDHGDLLALAGGGGMFLAVWSSEDQSELRATRIAEDGMLLDPDGFALLPSARGVSAAFDGERFVVVDDGRIMNVELDGLVSIDVPITEASNAVVSSLAAGPNSMLVAWEDTTRHAIYAARMARDLTPLDAHKIEISRIEAVPQVGYGAGAWLVAYVSRRALYGSMIALDGTSIFSEAELAHDADGFSLAGLRAIVDIGGDLDEVSISSTGTTASAFVAAPGEQRYPAAAACGTELAVAWRERGLAIETQRAAITSTVSISANTEAFAAVASDGEHELYAWWDDRTGNEPTIAVSIGEVAFTLPVVAELGPVRAAFAQDRFYVFWQERHEFIGYARISRDGALIDTVRIVGTVPYDVASDGSNVALFSVRGETLGVEWIDPLDDRRGRGFLTSVSQSRAQAVSVAGAADTWVVAWNLCQPSGQCELSTRVLASGNGPVHVDSGREKQLALAYNGSAFSVIFNETSSLVAVGFDPSTGRLIPGDERAFGSTAAVDLRAIFDGERTVILWREGDTVRTEDGTVISEHARASNVAMTARAPQTIVLAYERDVPERPYDTTRVFTRTLTLDPLPPARDAGARDADPRADAAGDSDGSITPAQDAGVPNGGALNEANADGCGCSEARARSGLAEATLIALLAALRCTLAPWRRRSSSRCSRSPSSAAARCTSCAPTSTSQ